MQKKQKQTEETPKKPADEKRKPYTAPKLKVHGNLGKLTAGSGCQQQTF